MEQDFDLLLNKSLNLPSLKVFISGPLPAIWSSKLFSRGMDLNDWLKRSCSLKGLNYIDNFDLFWQRGHLFAQDGLLNQHGARTLLDHVDHALRHPSSRHTRPWAKAPGNQLTVCHTSRLISSAEGLKAEAYHQSAKQNIAAPPPAPPQARPPKPLRPNPPHPQGSRPLSSPTASVIASNKNCGMDSTPPWTAL
ncbi:hypothetical protein SKAU_G00244240 [Synaphobranchus kaupii]|uniref:Uncharacterized protein n=1 Tax=Synaphobranchus kaupii TaxID=118154 RepID=A0A9Q1IP76_SYNKA|nr:hypothetical protein SKAU_G00244240 [Synaphobranchus kaupii]